MMDFLSRIRRDLNDPRNHHGGGGFNTCRVNAAALNELIRHFERMDSLMRANHHKDMVNPRQLVSESITALYLEKGGNAEEVWLVIMSTLLPLMNDKLQPRFAPRGPKDGFNR